MALGFSKILWGEFFSQSLGWCGRLILVGLWWMTLDMPLFVVSFFRRVYQLGVVYFIEFYALRVLRVFVISINKS